MLRNTLTVIFTDPAGFLDSHIQFFRCTLQGIRLFKGRIGKYFRLLVKQITAFITEQLRYKLFPDLGQWRCLFRFYINDLDDMEAKR